MKGGGFGRFSRWMGVAALLLGALLSGSAPAGADDFLDPAIAFKPALRAVDGQTLEIRYTIAPGYYLYRDKFRFTVNGPAQAGAPHLPAGKEKDDDNFGKVVVYYNQAVIRLPIERTASGPLDLTLRLTSQGCADAGVCYPPQTQLLPVQVPVETTPPAPPVAETNAAAGGEQDESGRIAGLLREKGFWANLGFFFLAGLGLALTPCVFPMIPILSGIIAGQKGQASRGRSVGLAVAYVLGMALTYAAAGIAAGLSGTLLAASLQTPWALGLFALIFVGLSLSMFGFYELQLPVALQSRLSSESGQFKHGLAGVFAMGALSALIVGPCVAAPLAGALLYIGQSGDAVLGGAALFTMALGMGAPLIAVGLAGGALLPKAGPWMEGVRRAFGVLLLATAVWLLGPVLPVAVQMAAWAALLIVPAIFLHALDPLPPQARSGQRFWKGVGILMLLTGASLLVGALGGGRDPLQPLAGWRGQLQAAESGPVFQKIRSTVELETVLRETAQRESKRPVMLDFYADWCVSCKEMERFTFSDPAVRARLASFTLLKADVTGNTPADQALLKRFGLYGPPGILFFDAQGQELPKHRIVGFQDAERFLKNLPPLGN